MNWTLLLELFSNKYFLQSSVELFSLCGTLYQYLVLATIKWDSDQWRDQLLSYRYDNSVLSEMHAPLHTFHALSNIFSHLKWDFKSYILIKAGQKTPKWVSDHHMASNQPICLCQLSPVSYMCSFLLLPKGQPEYALRQQPFITVLQVSPHASSLPFPTLPFPLPAVTTAEAAFSPSVASQQTGKRCR